MSDEPSAIPLADVFRAANELVSVGLIKDYALGGALAAIYYTEPVTAYDADIIFVASDKTLSAGISAIHSYLQAKGWRVEREHLLIKGFPVQFLAASDFVGELACAIVVVIGTSLLVWFRKKANPFHVDLLRQPKASCWKRLLRLALFKKIEF